VRVCVRVCVWVGGGGSGWVCGGYDSMLLRLSFQKIILILIISVLVQLLDQYIVGGVVPTRADLDHVFLRFGKRTKTVNETDTDTVNETETSQSQTPR
jgi:hypothetical protein